MANADLTRLLNEARVHLPGALDEGIRYTIFNALDEFFRTSEVWREDIDFDTTIVDLIYDIEPEEVTTSKIVRLIEVTNSSDISVYATMQTIGELELASIPTIVETLTATFVITVGDPISTTGVPVFPEWILAKYREAILSGVLGKMMMQPAKVYSNQTLAVYHLRRFEAAKSQGRVDVQRKNVRGAEAWQYPGGW